MKKEVLYPFVLSFVFSIFYVGVFSYSTSCLYTNPAEIVDPSFYKLIGWGWSEGKLPYIDLWDHKGPLIFFINAIGYILCGSEIGVMIIQVIFMTFTIFLVYQTYIVYFSKSYGIILTLFTLILLTVGYSLYGGGNFTEEYILPLILASNYCVLLWLKNVQGQPSNFPPKYALLMGLVLSFAFLTRLTNALSVCGCALVIALYLSFKKKWNNLLYNVFFFLVGFVLLTLPFIGYFSYLGILDEMWYGTIVFNLDYASDGVGPSLHSIKDVINYFFLYPFNHTILFLSLLFVIIYPKRRLANTIWFVSALLLSIWFVNSDCYDHYGILAIAFVPICFIEAKLFYNDQKSLFSKMIILFIGVTFLFYAKKATLVLCKLPEVYKSANKSIVKYKEMINVIPDKDKGAFLAYNCKTELYLYLKILPCFKIFSLQNNIINHREEIKNDLVINLKSGRIKWLMVNSSIKLHSEVSNVIENNYFLIKEDKTDNLMLYKFHQ